MEKISLLTGSELILGSSDSADSQALRRAVKAGTLRKIAPKLYTSNLVDEPATIIRRNAYFILGVLFPGAVLSHRSALEGGITTEGAVVLTYKYTKKLSLPGLIIHLVAGEGAQEGDMPFMEHLFLASRARALLENVQLRRETDGFRKILSQEEIETYLDKLCRVYGVEELNQLRAQARKLAELLGLQKEFQRLEQLIGALLGTRKSNTLKTTSGQARALGIPYDSQRLELFATLVAKIKQEILPIVKEAKLTTTALSNLAFFEAYFSNYIEGTEFEVDEAADIIFHNKIMLSRPQDSHDILGTFQLVSSISEMNKIPHSSDELIALLQRRHAALMSARHDKEPGQFKSMSNRVGTMIFVMPELVRGTLIKAFDLYEQLALGLERAIFMMFVIAEVHPFLDGNGRIARVMMNAELVHAGQCRIIIPTVYREDYLLALRRLSRERDADAYVRMLVRAQEFTASIDFSDYQQALEQLKRCNAFLQSFEGKLKH